MESCENCERTIGNLEAAFVWNERVVCGSCHQQLRGVENSPPSPRVQTVEQTSKVYKLQIVLGTVLFAGGLAVAVVPFFKPRGMWGGGQFEMLWGVLITGAAAVWLAVVKALIWWNHA